MVMTQGEFVSSLDRSCDHNILCNNLRVRDILEWEQGCYPFKSGFISFHYDLSSSFTINKLERQRESLGERGIGREGEKRGRGRGRGRGNDMVSV